MTMQFKSLQDRQARTTRLGQCCEREIIGNETSVSSEMFVESERFGELTLTHMSFDHEIAEECVVPVSVAEHESVDLVERVSGVGSMKKKREALSVY
ncbi:hypothetical protein Q3G72_008199 [Acer saccharum]|nr:hypothetical protein Q3G72_008199 [Acer saccharum]